MEPSRYHLIRVDNEVYQFLDQRRLQGLTFNDILRRLLLERVVPRHPAKSTDKSTCNAPQTPQAHQQTLDEALTNA